MAPTFVTQWCRGPGLWQQSVCPALHAGFSAAQWRRLEASQCGWQQPGLWREHYGTMTHRRVGMAAAAVAQTLQQLHLLSIRKHCAQLAVHGVRWWHQLLHWQRGTLPCQAAVPSESDCAARPAALHMWWRKHSRGC